jgi:hypothetical protein
MHRFTYSKWYFGVSPRLTRTVLLSLYEPALQRSSQVPCSIDAWARAARQHKIVDTRMERTAVLDSNQDEVEVAEGLAYQEWSLA